MHPVLRYFLLFAMITLFSDTVMANSDPPPKESIYSSQTSGFIKKFRLSFDRSQVRKDNTYRSQLFVTLDSNPKLEYTVYIGDDSEFSAEVITETLRYAYKNRLPITIFHEIPLRASQQFKILMVQISEEGSRQVHRSGLKTAINR